MEPLQVALLHPECIVDPLQVWVKNPLCESG